MVAVSWIAEVLTRSALKALTHRLVQHLITIEKNKMMKNY